MKILGMREKNEEKLRGRTYTIALIPNVNVLDHLIRYQINAWTLHVVVLD